MGEEVRWRPFALLVLAVLASGCTPSPGPVRSTPTGPPAATSQQREHGQDADEDTPAPPTTQAATVVAGFAQAWARPSADPHTWWAAVAVWCEEGLADKLRSVDPGNVPATAITGPPQGIGGSAADGLRFHVPTNTGTLQVTVAALGGQWKITTIDFDRTVR